MRRFYDKQSFSQSQQAVLGEAASHHIGKVLRMQPDDELVIFNGDGGEWHARITSVGKRNVTVDVLTHVANNRTPGIAANIALPIIKGDRMDYALQKATELGAAAFQPLVTERTEVKLYNDRIDKKLLHWQQVAISACEQCGMNRVPSVEPPMRLNEYLEKIATEAIAGALKLIAHPGEQTLPNSILCEATQITLLTGPEGGFSSSEVEAAISAGFQPFALGQRILRAETAPPALLAAIWMARGE